MDARNQLIRERNIQFQNYCYNGEIELAKAVFELEPNCFGIDFALNYARRHKQHDIKEWLTQVNQKREEEKRHREQMRPLVEQFTNLCANGELESARQFFELNPHTYLLCYSDALASALSHKHDEVAIWLLTSLNNYSLGGFDYAFSLACEYGRLEISQWILQEHPNIDIFVNDNNAFTWACIYGHKNVIEWLLTLNPNQYIHGIQHECALMRACQHDDVCHALWILCFKPDTNFTVVDDEKMQEKIFVLLLLYCFAHKNINLLML